MQLVKFLKNKFCVLLMMFLIFSCQNMQNDTMGSNRYSRRIDDLSRISMTLGEKSTTVEEKISLIKQELNKIEKEIKSVGKGINNTKEGINAQREEIYRLNQIKKKLEYELQNLITKKKLLDEKIKKYKEYAKHLKSLIEEMEDLKNFLKGRTNAEITKLIKDFEEGMESMSSDFVDFLGDKTINEIKDQLNSKLEALGSLLEKLTNESTNVKDLTDREKRILANSYPEKREEIKLLLSYHKAGEKNAELSDILNKYLINRKELTSKYVQLEKMWKIKYLDLDYLEKNKENEAQVKSAGATIDFDFIEKILFQMRSTDLIKDESKWVERKSRDFITREGNLFIDGKEIELEIDPNSIIDGLPHAFSIKFNEGEKRYESQTYHLRPFLEKESPLNIYSSDSKGNRKEYKSSYGWEISNLKLIKNEITIEKDDRSAIDNNTLFLFNFSSSKGQEKLVNSIVYLPEKDSNHPYSFLYKIRESDLGLFSNEILNDRNLQMIIKEKSEDHIKAFLYTTMGTLKSLSEVEFKMAKPRR